MPAWLMSAVRTAIQTGWGLLAAWSAARLGVTLPDDAPVWLTGMAVSGVTLVVTAVVRWLETRQSALPRRIGRLLMVGIARQPVDYRRPGPR